jgi:hypothetical protein
VLHYEYVRYLAEGHGLPVSDLETEMPWHQEGSQPPLYYLLGAAITFWIDTADAPSVIRYNPHAVVGVADAPDNKNMMVHTAPEAFPYRGTVLAAHLVRLLSVLTGAATVVGTYVLALSACPESRGKAAIAAVILAFNPQFILISASVNNDNLVTLLGCLGILVLVHLWQEGVKVGGVALLGVIAGLVSITKLNGLVLLPFMALVLVAAAWQSRSLRSVVAWGVVTALPALVIGGWWYWRNWRNLWRPLWPEGHVCRVASPHVGPGSVRTGGARPRGVAFHLGRLRLVQRRGPAVVVPLLHWPGSSRPRWPADPGSSAAWPAPPLDTFFPGLACSLGFRRCGRPAGLQPETVSPGTAAFPSPARCGGAAGSGTGSGGRLDLRAGAALGSSCPGGEPLRLGRLGAPGIIVPAYAALIPLVELPSRKLYPSQPHSPGGSARWATSCRRPPYSLATSYT